MASSFSDLPIKILDTIVDKVVEKVVHHVGYIFRYEKNINELEDKKKNLEKIMKKNKQEVEKASIRSDIVEEEVQDWAHEADNKKSKAENLMAKKARDENVKFLIFLYPNLCSCYRMSKEAMQMKGDIEKHIEHGNFEVVARSQTPPSELEFTSNDNFMNFDSREPLIKLIKDKLKSRNPEDNMIGVHGAGGIGKTTAVEQVSKNLKKEGVFSEVVKGVVSRDVNVHEIQRQLAHDLCLDIDSKIGKGRRDALWNRLNNGKNNLVILDDLWEEVKLKDIGIPLRKGNKGCKVILTTRNRQVLTDMDAVGYILVEVLSKHDALALIQEKVKVDFTTDELRVVAESVCEECHGLPIAILAVGRELAGKTETPIWYNALDQLRNSSWEKIDRGKMYASLRCSYDDLEKTSIAKSILLICCLYPEDDNIPVDFLLFHCIARSMLPDQNTVDGARNRIITLVSFLKDRSLLLDGKDKDHVKMHNVIRDVVIAIAKTDERYLVKNVTNCWPDKSINEEMVAISVHLDELKEVPKKPVCSQLHTLRIECKHFSNQFPDNFFIEVREIRVLELKGIHMSPTPSSLANLSELRTLILIDSHLEDMFFLKGLKSNLEVLVVDDSDTKALPMELGELSQLRVLLMNNCCRLKEGKGILELEHFVIKDCHDLEQLLGTPDRYTRNQGLNQSNSFSKLTILVVSNCSFKFLFTSSCAKGLQQLKKLHTSNCNILEEIIGTEGEKDEEDHFDFSKLKELRLEDLPKLISFGPKTKEKATVEGDCLPKGQSLFNEKVIFPALERLQIRGLPNIIEICDKQVLPTKYFPHLANVEVSGCEELVTLFPSNLRAVSLRSVSVRNCKGIIVVVSITGLEESEDANNYFIIFPKLRYVNLFNLENLNAFYGNPMGPKPQSLFDPQVIFPALEELEIWSLPNITEIWNKKVLSANSFPHLARVWVSDCKKLVTVFPSNSWAKSLRSVSVINCKEVTVVVSIIGFEKSDDAKNCPITFPLLSYVELTKLENLNAFCGNSTGPKLQSLFDPRVRFPALEEIMLDNLPNIEIFKKRLSKGEVMFPAIWNLTIGYETWYDDGKPNKTYLAPLVLE